MTDRPEHPSGKPIKRPQYGIRSIYRIPEDQPLTPGLRKRQGAMAIGFTARLTSDEDDDR